jgi:hypothetical protein
MGFAVRARIERGGLRFACGSGGGSSLEAVRPALQSFHFCISSSVVRSPLCVREYFVGFPVRILHIALSLILGDLGRGIASRRLALVACRFRRGSPRVLEHGFGLSCSGRSCWFGALKVAKKQHSFQDFLITAALSLGMVALSLYFQVRVPQHEVLKAVSFSAWFAALGRALAWPFSGPPVAAVAVYFPVLTLLISYCLKRRAVLNLERSQPVEALVGVAFWVVLQAAAIAYGRGGDGSQCPGSRHMDLLAPGVLVNLFAVVTLLSVNRQSSWIRCGANLAGTVWMMWVLYGVVGTSHDQFSQCLARHGGIRSDEEHVRAYVATRDRGYLEDASRPLLPLPDPSQFAMLLDDPSIRQILPAVVRAPLRIEKESDLGNGFVSGGYPREIAAPPYERTWGSFSTMGGSSQGAMESGSITPHLLLPSVRNRGIYADGLVACSAR